MKAPKPRWRFSTIEEDKWLDGPFALICDLGFYNQNEDKIVTWLKECTPHWRRQGAVLIFSKREHLTLFQLTWDQDLA